MVSLWPSHTFLSGVITRICQRDSTRPGAGPDQRGRREKLGKVIVSDIKMEYLWRRWDGRASATRLNNIFTDFYYFSLSLSSLQFLKVSPRNTTCSHVIFILPLSYSFHSLFLSYSHRLKFAFHRPVFIHLSKTSMKVNASRERMREGRRLRKTATGAFPTRLLTLWIFYSQMNCFASSLLHVYWRWLAFFSASLSEIALCISEDVFIWLSFFAKLFCLRTEEGTSTEVLQRGWDLCKVWENQLWVGGRRRETLKTPSIFGEESLFALKTIAVWIVFVLLGTRALRTRGFLSVDGWFLRVILESHCRSTSEH